MRLLFVTWDGPEQSYLESLFLPILGGLARHGIAARVMQLRYGPKSLETAAREASEARGIPYLARPILRRPTVLGGAVATVGLGAPALAREVRRAGVDVVMPRSLLPGAMTLAARPMLGGARIVFDADGLMADERVELGGWRADGAPYRALRAVERRLLRVADGVMTRTHAAKEILLERAGPGVPPDRIGVVPNGVDGALFRPRDGREAVTVRARYGVPAHAPFIVWSGSIGPQYMPEVAFAFFERVRARRPDARLAVLTGAVERAAALVREAGIPDASVRVARLSPAGVAEVLGAADLGLALRLPTFSQRAISPIKVSEYLLAGLPVLATRGVGDLDAALVDPRVAHRLDADAPDLDVAVTWFLEGPLAARDISRSVCRALGEDEFGLELAVDRVASIVRRAAPDRA